MGDSDGDQPDNTGFQHDVECCEIVKVLYINLLNFSCTKDIPLTCGIPKSRRFKSPPEKSQ